MRKKIPCTAADPESIPSYATSGSAGADLRAHLSEPVVIQPGTSAIIPTGLRVELPEGYELQVRPRSGLAAKNQITVLNTPGTIDSDYRGEICVILINHGLNPFVVEPRMRIAQLILASVIQAEFLLQEKDLAMTERGEGGFGHSGTQ